jgi:MoaA/NifB/PqqE/SkfB family radical SAM enzyme
MIADMLRKEGADYPSVHLYTNGIRVGKDEAFARRYLPLWKSLGLETLYVTVHDVDPVRNARIYGVKKYPDLETIVRRIHAAGLKVRANMVLAKTTTHTLEVFVHMVTELQSIGFDAVTAWPIRGDDDRIDRSLAPPEVELMRMSSWTQRHTRPHAPVRLLLDSDRMAYESGQKLTLFPNGTVSNKWCP